MTVRLTRMMRKLVILGLLGLAVAAVAAASAAAKPPGTNGLISFTRFDPALQQDVAYTDRKSTRLNSSH